MKICAALRAAGAFQPSRGVAVAAWESITHAVQPRVLSAGPGGLNRTTSQRSGTPGKRACRAAVGLSIFALVRASGRAQ